MLTLKTYAHAIREEEAGLSFAGLAQARRPYTAPLERHLGAYPKNRALASLLYRVCKSRRKSGPPFQAGCPSSPGLSATLLTTSAIDAEAQQAGGYDEQAEWAEGADALREIAAPSDAKTKVSVL